MSFEEHLTFIDEQYEHMKQLAHDWSAINSGSYNIEGLAKMLDVLKDNFMWLDGEMEILDLASMESIDSHGNNANILLGQALRIRKRPDAPKQVFLGGHYDTVFGKDHPFQKPVIVDDNTINGPGITDLKGGLVVMLKALEAFEKSPYADQLGWEILLNPDEEIGSPGSDILLKEAASRNQFGMIYEPSMPDGSLVSERKGSGNYIVVVRGTAAHAGREHHLGRNAIVRLAGITEQINNLNGQMPGVTINPGIVKGGSTVNTVPDLAILHFNVRVGTTDDQAWVENELYQLSETFRHDMEYGCTIHGGFTRPPKPMQTRDHNMWNGLVSTGNMLGLSINWQASGGCCDGNNLAAYGLPNIDTLGVRGGDIHSDKEYILLDSLTERAKLSALMLMRYANGDISL